MSAPWLEGVASLQEIEEEVLKLYDEAEKRPNRRFYIPYLGGGSAAAPNYLNGYHCVDMVRVFITVGNRRVPPNLVFEEKFRDLLILRAHHQAASTEVAATATGSEKGSVREWVPPESWLTD